METDGEFTFWALGEHGRAVHLSIPARVRWEGERGRATLEIPAQLGSVAESCGGRRQITFRTAEGIALEFVTPDFLPSHVATLTDARSAR